ncbi:MAG: PDZ domain-containing protein [Verrucomicrobiales bacterium]
MKKIFLLLISSFFTVASIRAAEEKAPAPIWEQALVTIEANRKQYDYHQPWSRQVGQVQKMGTIIGDNQILTTADFLANVTLIRLQKGGRGRWYKGEVSWVDYHANLALVTTSEEGFWKETTSTTVLEKTPVRGEAQIVRWRNGILDYKTVDINRMTVKKAKLSLIDLPFLEVDTEMAGLGWAEALVQGNKLVGLTSSKEEHSATVIPAHFIHSCLDDRKAAPYNGLGFFPFIWQQAENPSVLAYLGQEGEPRGVIITEVNTNKLTSPLLPKDIIEEIDGHAIDVQGDYKDPDYGNLLLEAIATRNKRAGDEVKIKIIRNQKPMEIAYKLPKVDYSLEVVPHATPDQDPEYLIVGGILFQPLTVPYLQSWGSDWARKAPFRLSYATRDEGSPNQKAYVVLTAIMPDPINLGYQDVRYVLLDEVNHQPIQTLHDLAGALTKPVDGFHIMEFKEGDSIRRIVLDAEQVDPATKRVMQRYGIQSDRHMPAKGKQG